MKGGDYYLAIVKEDSHLFYCYNLFAALNEMYSHYILPLDLTNNETVKCCTDFRHPFTKHWQPP